LDYPQASQCCPAQYASNINASSPNLITPMFPLRDDTIESKANFGSAVMAGLDPAIQ
jgi:hypothetical protein